MKVIGLDIGTTTLCAALLDLADGTLVQALTRPNTAALASDYPWARQQAPAVILAECRSMLDEMLAAHNDVAALGISGQMHGMLYVDASGRPAGPLHTWQDQRGNLEMPQGGTYAQAFARETGLFAASGFGLVTLFYDASNGLVPANAAGICTIGDYVAMALCGLARPRLHASSAASLGGYNLAAGGFAQERLPRAINRRLLPAVLAGEELLGSYKGLPVCCAIGDNQASVFGSLGPGVRALVNVGTGSQISALSEEPVLYTDELECRPYVNKQFLSVGAALCGGYAYSLLRQFFAQTAGMLGAPVPADLYRRMDSLAEEACGTGNPLQVDTRFNGTRANPGCRGSIGGIDANNLTPGALCLGVLEGMCRELRQLGAAMQPPLQPGGTLAASGNGIRNSGIARRIFASQFGMQLAVPRCKEEAAYGAGLIAAVAAGIISWPAARALVQYE